MRAGHISSCSPSQLLRHLFWMPCSHYQAVQQLFPIPAVTQLCRLLVAQAVNHPGSCHSAFVQKLFTFRQVSINQLSRHLFLTAADYSNCLYSCSLSTSCPIAVLLTVCSKCCLSKQPVHSTHLIKTSGSSFQPPICVLFTQLLFQPAVQTAVPFGGLP